MSFPTIYDVTYSYAGFAASLGNGSFPGTQLDADLAGLDQADQNILAFLQQIARADGKLANNSVGPDQISPALNLGFTMRGGWAENTDYSTADGVSYGEVFYKANFAHRATSETRPDLDPATWTFLFAFSSISITDGSVLPQHLASGMGAAFRTKIEAPSQADFTALSDSVSSLQTGTLPRSEFPTPVALAYLRRNAVNSGFENRNAEQLASDVIPAGFVMFSPKGTSSTGWLVCDGSSFVATTYPALYAYLGNTTTLPDYRDRTLRGAGPLAGTAGTTQEDALQGHWHRNRRGSDNANNFDSLEGGAGGNSYDVNGTGSVGSTYAAELISDSVNGTPRVASETRVKAGIGAWVIKAH